ncbi:MAG: S-layer homology domain-containing protein [Clostridia bacterium]
MKKAIALILIGLLFLIITPGIVMTVQAETEIVPKTDFYYIDSDGEYQLAEDYEGIIFINSDVTEVTITDTVYKAKHINTSIVVLGIRTEALELTIEDIDISSANNRPAIDFKNAGNFENKLYINGTCSLISSSPFGCINVPEGVELEIDKLEGLVNDEDAILSVINNGWHGAGIGGGIDGNHAAGTIIISGGTITARGGIYSAGIGGGTDGAGGTIIINEGIVNATGGVQAAGIGGGVGGVGGNITIAGGTVTAVSVHGGAGIGGGNSDSNGGNDGGNIIISGGIVTAICEEWGAGIGGGNEGAGGTVTINGGTVTAISRDKGGAGIGGGNEGDGGSTTINGGTVTASGSDGGAGIGGGKAGVDYIDDIRVIKGGLGVSTIINGGTVIANGSYCAAGIGGGWNGQHGGIITISGGSVEANGGSNGAGIGGGFGCSGGDVTIIGTPVVFASSRNDWGSSSAMPIGHGYEYEDLEPGTLKDGEGNNISYIRFSAEDMDTGGIADVKIAIDESNDVYYTNDQGLYVMFVPFEESKLYSYTMSKTGYSAIKGSHTLSSVSLDMGGTMFPDAFPPIIIGIKAETKTTTYINCDAYGIYGTLYMVPKVEADYTSKTALDGVVNGISVALINNSESVKVDASMLSDGVYQFYLVDSAENVSVPIEKALPFSLKRNSYNGGSSRNGVSTILKTPTLKTGSNVAGIEVNMAAVENAFQNAVANAEGITAITLEILAVKGALGYEAALPADVLSGEPDRKIKLKTELGEVILPSAMLTPEMAGNAKSAAITLGKGDITKLTAEVQAQLGSKPIIELILKLDGKVAAWNNPSAPVTISIPYSPTEEELAAPEHITVWYIDGLGNVVSVPSGRYDTITGTVSFTTTHFSKFAVVYVRESFNDLDIVPWAKKQIEVLASKGIMEGREGKKFVPTTGITRAEYIGALVRTLGVSAKAENSFSDVKVGDRYYNEIGIAKKLGITEGIGNNYFDPETLISRQDMMVLTERALRNLKRIIIQGTYNDLEEFSDRAQLAEYAVNGIAALVKEGLIEGSNGKLNLGSESSRAEAATFLYRIYNR